MDWLRRLESLGACTEATAWARTQPDAKTAWTTCRDGRWMLWISSRLGVRSQTVASAACKCARLPLRYLPHGEDRPLKAIKTTERWTRGEARIEEVREARENAVAYAAAAYAAAAYADADAAAAAAYAAAAYADADADADARQKAREDTLAQCADLVRETIPWEIIEELI